MENELLPEKSKPVFELKKLTANRIGWLPIILISLLSLFAISGAALTPFHPDESTYLYMSSDFNLLLNQPQSMAYTPANEEEVRQRYRLIDAPLTRYYLGLVRLIFGLEAPASDWDWSSDWKTNHSIGAAPTPELLQVSRIAISLLFPCCLVLIFLIGKELQGENTGILAVLFFGLNALALLHNRRIMAEAWLTLGILLCMYIGLKTNMRPWLGGLAAAIVFNAKHSGFLLIPILLGALLWRSVRSKETARRALWDVLQFCAIFLIITILLNPVFWKDPLSTAAAAWHERTDLVAKQAADAGNKASGNLGQQVMFRSGILTANLYLTELAFYEVGNYAAHTAASEQSYLQVPGHQLLRSPVGAGLALFLTLFGLITSLRSIKAMPIRQKRAHCLLWLTGCILFIGTVAMVPLPWQRYAMPLVPVVSLWMAYGLAQVALDRIGKHQNLFKN